MGKNIYIGDSNNLARKVKDIFVGVETYFPVEYIESSGTQYIDTGFKISNNSKIVTKLAGVSGGNFFASGKTGQYVDTAIYITSAGYYVGRWRNSSTSNISVTSSITEDLNTPHDFELSKDGFYIDNSLIGATSSYSFTASYNLFLFAMNNQGTATGFATSSRIYNFKIYNNDTLERELIPVLDENNVACLYDKISGKAFYNSGTGSFTYGNRTSENPIATNKRVIKAYVGDSNNVARECYRKYTRVNYIESSGTQYIDTNFLPTADDEIIIKNATINHPTTTGANWCVLSAGSGATNYRLAFTMSATSSNNKLYFNWFTKTTTNYSQLVTINNSILKLNENGFYIDDNLITTSTGTRGTPNTNLFFFTQSDLSNYSTAKIGEIIIKRNNEIIKDYIPCLDENNVACFYEIISGTFFYNQGTGTFNYG